MTKNIGRRGLAAVLGAAIALALPVSAQAQGDHAKTQAVLNAYQAESGPGAAVYGGDSAGSWQLTAGTGNTTAKKPIQPTEHFRIASQTKTFAAAVVLQLVDEGKVALDAPIEQYLPGVVTGNGYDGTKISVRQLLQHTSGIPTNRTPKPKANPDGTYSLDAVVRDGLSLPPVSAPGAEWHYSNTNYEILGMLIEKYTGTPVAQAITTRIIQPLGLTQTTFPAAGDRSVPNPAVRGYNGGRIGPVFYWFDVTTGVEPSLYSSSGAMISTQQDLAAFDHALLGGKVVSPAALAEMQKTFPVGQGAGYGLGLSRVDLSCGGSAWGHSGSTPGYVSMTVVTGDGRHASLVTNAQIESPKLVSVLDSALCDK